ncbi:MAG: SAM-dependent methyltransferase [Solirubrobacteraceae bacterium]
MTGRRIHPDWFEDLYRSRPDPWSFATSSYEAAKYTRTLAALGPPERRFGRALEAGCSIGVFTELLAPRCDELVAIDASATAVARTSERLRGLPHVRVERRTLPEELPPGPFDLIVCSEILYYWSADLLRDLLAALASTLAPGGALVAVHWRPATRTYPLRGDDVHWILSESPGLVHAFGEGEPRYLIDRYERAR